MIILMFSGSSLRREGRPRTPVKRPKSVGTAESILRTPGSSSDFKLEVGMSVFCNNELGNYRHCFMESLCLWHLLFHITILGSLLFVLRDKF